MKRFKLLPLLLAVVFIITACGTQSSYKNKTTETTADTVSTDNTDTVPGGNETPAETTADTVSTDNTDTVPGGNETPAETQSKIYLEACEELIAGHTVEAYNKFKQISDYAPASEKLKNFFYVPTVIVEKSKYAYDSDYSTRTEIYSYDSNGNVIKIEFRNVTHEYVYNADGNVISGPELIYGYNDDTHYEYENGKLKRVVDDDYIKTYTYNEKGLVIKETRTNANNYSSYEYNYTYTYYSNGNVKTMQMEDYAEYKYDKSGQLTTVLFNEPENVTVNLTYGKYGIANMEVNAPYFSAYGKFIYTYDNNGALYKLEIEYYEDGALYKEYELEFVDNRLFYSENPNIIERADIITYKNVDAALDIIW